MTILIVATVCLAATCSDRVIATSDTDPSVNMMTCQIGAQALMADWLRKNPGYTIKGGWRCVAGRRGQDA